MENVLAWYSLIYLSLRVLANIFNNKETIKNEIGFRVARIGLTVPVWLFVFSQIVK